MYVCMYDIIFLHVIHNARLNDIVIALTGISHVLLYCVVLYCYISNVLEENMH